MLDLAELAHDRGALECFTHVSTAYVAGTHPAPSASATSTLARTTGTPTSARSSRPSCWSASGPSRLPVQVVRPSIVVGDSRTGWTPAFNVLYWPLRAFARGSYPVLPASRASPVDVVPVDYVADALLELGGRPGTTFHLTAADRASDLGELVTSPAAT